MRKERQQQLLEWIDIDSTSGHEGDFLTRLEADAQREGLHTRRVEVPGEDPATRWNLLLYVEDPNPDVWLSTHVDTVPPFLPARLEDETFYGRGACDTKGVLLAMFEALQRFRQTHPTKAKRAGILLVIGEETDHCGAAAAAEMDLTPRRIILGEPTECRIAVGQKGILKATVSTRGVAGHSAFPDRGHSAIHDLLEILHDVRNTPWPSDPNLGDTTLNVGTIQGGVAANVFAPDAEAVLMFRIVSPSEDVETQLRHIVGKRGAVNVISRGEPQHYEIPDGFDPCVLKFNSDAAWLSRLAPIWLTGPGDIRLAHSDHERITTGDFDQGVELYLRLLQEA